MVAINYFITEALDEQIKEDELSYILRSGDWSNATVDALNVGLKVTPPRMNMESARQFCQKIPGYDLAMAKNTSKLRCHAGLPPSTDSIR